MRLPIFLMSLLTGVLGLAGPAAAPPHHLAETWSASRFEPREFRKIFIIGIAGLTEERKQFENKFVSHLRTRKIDGMTSHSLVPHLDRVEDREAIVLALGREGIDGAITVRLVPLENRTEEEWAAGWQRWVGSGPRIRGLVEETLPVPERKAKRYGVEVALWEPTNWDLVWAARTDVYKRRELSGEAASLVQTTMSALWDAGLIPLAPVTR